jgi:ribosomal protein S18 acetylase RimI-like enzyme
MITPDRLEAYLRRAASLSYQTKACGPFVLYFNPHDALRFFNYAKPARPFPTDERGAAASPALADLIAAFEARGRLPRFEFIEEYAPGLPAILRTAGFDEEARQHLMVCDAASFTPVAAPPGVTLRELTPDAPLDELRACIAMQRQGFSEDDAATADDEEAERMRSGLGSDGALTLVAWRGDEPVGAGGCTALLDGLSELVGVATPPRYRRQGIATALTSAAVAAQLAAGAEAVILTAQDARAGRIYERVGFRPAATMLAYARPV